MGRADAEKARAESKRENVGVMNFMLGGRKKTG
jgi:hypothetical protein